jgi:calcium binding protein
MERSSRVRCASELVGALSQPGEARHERHCGIPEIPDRATRLAEITVDCYGREEELSAFNVYLSDALRPPFVATWRDPDEPGHAEPVTVLGGTDLDERRGILLQVRRRESATRGGRPDLGQ